MSTTSFSPNSIGQNGIITVPFAMCDQEYSAFWNRLSRAIVTGKSRLELGPTRWHGRQGLCKAHSFGGGGGGLRAGATGVAKRSHLCHAHS